MNLEPCRTFHSLLVSGETPWVRRPARVSAVTGTVCVEPASSPQVTLRDALFYPTAISWYLKAYFCTKI